MLHATLAKALAQEVLDWLVRLIPHVERNGPVDELARRLTARPPRSGLRPDLEFDPRRLIRKLGA